MIVDIGNPIMPRRIVTSQYARGLYQPAVVGVLLARELGKADFLVSGIAACEADESEGQGQLTQVR